MASRTDYAKMIAAFASGFAPSFGGSMLEKKRFRREQEATQAAEESRREFEKWLLGERIGAEAEQARLGREFQAGEAEKQREFLGEQARRKEVSEAELRTQEATEAFRARQEQSAQQRALIEGYIYATRPEAVVTKPTGELDYEATVRNLTPEEYKDLLYIQARGVPAEPTREWPSPRLDERLSTLNTIVDLIPYASPEQQEMLRGIVVPLVVEAMKEMGIPLPEKLGETPVTEEAPKVSVTDVFNIPKEARYGPFKFTGAAGDVLRKFAELYFSAPYFKGQEGKP